MFKSKNKIKKTSYFLAMVFIFFSFMNLKVFAVDDLSNSLKENIIPIDGLEVNRDFSDLENMKESLEEKRIIGIGESTPGASQFYSLKTRMVEYLVKAMDYRVLAFHGNYADIQLVDDYINGKGDIEDAIWQLRPFPWTPEKLENNQGYSIASHSYLAPYSTAEFKDILIWLREYNSNASKEEKIKIYGIGFENPEKSIYDLIDYIGKVDEESSKIYKKRLSDLKMVHGFDFKYPEPRALGLFIGMLEELNEIIKSKEEDYIEKSSIEEYEIGIKNLTTNFQWMEYRKTNLSSGMNAAIDLKEQYLFENVKWILDREIEEGLIIWSNNKDIAKNNEEYIPMGHHLHEEYGENYYAIGLDFFKGRFRAYAVDIWGSPISNFIAKFNIDKSEKDYLVYHLEKTGIPFAFLDFKSAASYENIKELLEKQQKIHNATFMYPGKYVPRSLLPYFTQQYVSEVPMESYDGFLFASEISETKGLADSRDTKIENGDKAIVDHYRDIIAGQIGTILTILLVIVLIIIWLFKKWKKKKTKPGARYPGSGRWD